MTAVVVGGGSGIGAALVARYRAAGEKVVVWDVAGDRDVTCDVLDPASIDAALDATGVPDELTVTAGVGHAGSLLDARPEDWDRVVGVNARGVWLAMRTVARAMVDAGTGGSIVATSSVSGRLADRGMGLYCASKAALDMIVRVAAVEWAGHGIRVNAVAPGVTATPMLPVVPATRPWLDGVAARTPLGRLGTAEDVAEAVAALHGASWVTGHVLTADGGLSLRSPIDP